jgi:4-hydroxy-tetrahydrodipicolinate reductase
MNNTPHSLQPLAIMGYGKMGKEIEALAGSLPFELVAVLDRGFQEKSLDWVGKKPVVIEFSEPESAPENIRFCLEQGLPTVVGTTGWYAHEEELKAYCNKMNGALLKGSNFSPGVNLFFALNAWLANRMNQLSGYRAALHEVHHTRKKDAPSGTAISLAQGLIKEHSGYQDWKLGKDSYSDLEGLLPVTYDRSDDVPGIHQIQWSSEDDMLQIKHEAYGRKGFARGALMGALWIAQRKGWHDVSEMYAFAP